MEYVPPGTIPPLTFLLVCFLFAAGFGLWTLIRYLRRPKCDDCGLRLPAWNAKLDFSLVHLTEKDRAYLVPLCARCFARRTTKKPAQRWIHI